MKLRLLHQMQRLRRGPADQQGPAGHAERIGQVLNGLLVEKSEQEVVLKSPQNKLLKVPANQVELLAPQQKSLMPDLLLRDLTPQQAADLLAFLGSLK